MELTPSQKKRFDLALEEVLGELPEDLLKLFDEIPLVVEDFPPPGLLRKLRVARPEYLRGLHTGIPLTRRSVNHSGVLPTVITIYRLGIWLAAGRSSDKARPDDLRRQIRITVLHELGHHFGFGEEELRRYGYG